MIKSDVYLSLGSNLGNRQEMLSQAVRLLTERIGEQKGLSAFYETEPWGFHSSHPFLNAVLILSTKQSIEDVFRHTRSIERELGRTTKSVGGEYHDRPIDIDILMYGDMVAELDFLFDGETTCAHLSLPHPLMCERLFVIQPLAQIAPDVCHPILHQPYGEILKTLI